MCDQPHATVNPAKFQNGQFPGRLVTCKLDFDSELRAFRLAKPLMAGLAYPYDWGFIPSTKAEDGDPLDVLVIHNAQTYPGVVLRCKPVGILELEQKKKGKKERNDRVFAVPDRSPLETDLPHRLL
jgi:inorganic pyrophosphatase